MGRPVPHRSTAALAVALLLAAGCGGDDGSEGAPTTTEPRDQTTTTGSTTTTSTATTSTTSTSAPPAEDGVDPVGDPGREEVTSPEGFPAGSGSTALLVDVRVAARDGFDRVVFELEGDDPPSYRVAPLEPPVRQDFSGHELEVAGTSFLEVRMDRAAGFDPLSDDARPTYLGPDRIPLSGGGVVEELLLIGDFEGQNAWVIGLERDAPFGVTMLEDPIRLVVDVVAEG